MSFVTPSWDLSILVWINQTAQHEALDFIMPILSQQIWLWLVLVGVVVVILSRFEARKLLPLLCILLAVGATDLSSSLLKGHSCRVRPYNALSSVRHRHEGTWAQHSIDPKQAKERGTSFPSAHAANSMIIALLLMSWRRKLKPWALLLPLFVGYSRIYLGKHYPSDILAGWMLGLTLALVFQPLMSWIEGTRPSNRAFQSGISLVVPQAKAQEPNLL